jgi:PKD repeat protein
MTRTLRTSLLLPALLLFHCLHAQCPGCVPDLTCVSDPAFPTLCPSAPPDATAGVAYQADLTFWLPPTFTDPGTGFTVNFQQMTVTGVQGLPFGLSFQTNAPGSVYYPQENAYGCARVCGTPLTPGTFAVDIAVLASVNFNGFNIDVPQTFSLLLNVLPGSGGNTSFTYGPTAGCGSVTASFEALINGSPQITAYLWDLGNGSTSTAAVPPPQTYSTPGIHVISLQTTISAPVLDTLILTGVNDNWCGAVEEPDVPFVGCTGTPDPYFVLTDGGGNTYTSSTVDNSTTATWTGLGLVLDTPPYSISFYDEDAVSQNDLLGTFNLPTGSLGTTFFNVAGGTTGNVRIGLQVQQSFSDTDTVTVFAVPELSLQQDEGNGTLCATPNDLVNYVWFHDGDTVPNADGPCLLPDSAGLWWVEAISAQGCSATSDTAVVCPTVTIERDGLTLFVPNVFTSYAWSTNGQPIGGDQPFLIAPADGTYTLTVTDANGCEVTVIYVLSTVGVAEQAGVRSLPVFPNPSDGRFTITLPAGIGQALARLVDASGRLVQRFAMAGGVDQHTLSASVTPGSYLLLVEAQDGQRWQARVVVE